MKKLLLLLSVIIVSMIALNSCSKYEEGPAFSLRTKMNRITGKWIINEIRENGEKIDIPDYIRLSIELKKDGTGIYEIVVTRQDYQNPLLHRENIEWNFAMNKEILNISGEDKENIKKSLKGPISDEEDDDEELIVNENKIKKLFDINLNAQILRLTNTELWLIEVLEGEDLQVVRVDLRKDIY